MDTFRQNLPPAVAAGLGKSCPPVRGAAPSRAPRAELQLLDFFASLARRLGLLYICATHPCLAMGRRTRARIIYRCRVYRPFHTMAQPPETLSLVTKQEPRRN